MKAESEVVMEEGGTPVRVPLLLPDAADAENSTEFDFVLAVGKDEKLMRRLNELDNAETCSTSNRGTDAKWKLDPDQVVPALQRFSESK